MEDYVDFNIKHLKDYILTNGDMVMFAESGLRVWEVIIVILGINTRFNLNYKGGRALIEAKLLMLTNCLRNCGFGIHYWQAYGLEKRNLILT